MRLLQFTSCINIVQTQFIASQQNGEAIQTQKRAKHIQTPKAQKREAFKRRRHRNGVSHRNSETRTAKPSTKTSCVPDGTPAPVGFYPTEALSLTGQETDNATQTA